MKVRSTVNEGDREQRTEENRSKKNIKIKQQPIMLSGSRFIITFKALSPLPFDPPSTRVRPRSSHNGMSVGDGGQFLTKVVWGMSKN
ncbi:hypothetical protein AVEN_89578-1 [Araneus ventricosus]|uniref:Uncharacterized protein n=1 Tax=Araneus ventricosus TaxID=182803 RepID=A0A4Y2UQP9_ARAVE|nr:hypothetical protein AVEN_107449-1 [Araneus ventricosus]GBO15058.1 hypothetical protein AVEN_89578-1 [Araneus ventricosus]